MVDQVITIEKDELRRALAVRQRFAELTHEYGKLGLAQRTINKERESIEERFDTLIEEEEQLIQELNDKYGIGVLNVETGEFTPDNE